MLTYYKTCKTIQVQTIFRCHKSSRLKLRIQLKHALKSYKRLKILHLTFLTSKSNKLVIEQIQCIIERTF